MIDHQCDQAINVKFSQTWPKTYKKLSPLDMLAPFANLSQIGTKNVDPIMFFH